LVGNSNVHSMSGSNIDPYTIFQEITNNSNRYIWVATAEMDELLYLNDAAKAYFAESRAGTASFEGFFASVHEDDLADQIALVTQMQQWAAENNPPKEIHDEYRIYDKNDEIRWVSDHTFPIYNTEGDVYRWGGFIRDITEEKKSQKELVEARNRLEQTNRKLEQFADVVSHDLRNPLNVAQGRVRLAAAETNNEHLEAVTRSLDKMEILISDLLSLAREGKTIETMEWVSIAEVINNAWSDIGKENLSIEIESNFDIQADPNRLEQMFGNLFRNSLDHGEGAISVTIGDIQEGFYVADNGPGINKENRNRVFERGYTTSNVGTGLGLGIVEEIAHAHGWTISATDPVESGVRFEIVGVKKRNQQA